MSTYEKLLELFQSNNIKFREVTHVLEGSCEKISAIRNNVLSQAMKAIVIQAKISKSIRRYYLVIVPGDRSLDLNAIKKHTLAKDGVSFAQKDKAELLTECVMGAVPPFSFNNELKIIADPSIKDNQEIVFNAGMLDRSIFISIEDYVKLANPEFASIAKAKELSINMDNPIPPPADEKNSDEKSETVPSFRM